MDPSNEAPGHSFVMVVQRGDEERYRLLKQLFQSPRVNVVLDRRVGERRAGGGGDGTPSRRAGERRAPLPDTWVNLGFFVARSQQRRP